MATFRNGHGKRQARFQRKGQQPVSRSFQSKEDAQKWARQVEADPPLRVYTVRPNRPRTISPCDTYNQEKMIRVQP